MNLQQYANHRKALGLRGTSHVAVLKAIQAGRLAPPAVTRKGRGWEINAELADQQWADATDPKERGAGYHRGEEPPPDAKPLPPTKPPPQWQEPGNPKGVPPRAVSESVLAAVKAKRETMALHREEKKLLPRDQVEKAMADNYTIIRTKLLALPTRARQRIPHLTLEEVAILDELQREALEDLASGY